MYFDQKELIITSLLCFLYSSNYFHVYTTNFAGKVFYQKLTAAAHQFLAILTFSTFPQTLTVSAGGFTAFSTSTESPVNYKTIPFLEDVLFLKKKILYISHTPIL
jgi:hypothetical protein